MIFKQILSERRGFPIDGTISWEDLKTIGPLRKSFLMSHKWSKSSVFQTERELQSKLESHLDFP